ncbi:nicotinate-nucleotide adenylyltransferase [Salipaludibacillus sp. HK11]|uniref:nicotinate-nucleotide adenylyltransferase n=1 Tax=Salipaludibacillus sp. HK11 TaxID=3394320 RepID=UPI0039FB8C17
MKKIGLLGGTFDPPHVGHLIMAEEARLKGNLDEIWWMPNRIPPHKELSSGAPEHQRIRLVEKMVEQHSTYKFSRLELERSGPSYTVDTIRHLLKTRPNDDFSFIMGGDSLKHFHLWYQSEELQRMLRFIVLVRPGFAVADTNNFKEILVIDDVSLELSSSYIREKIKGKSFNQFLLTKEVYQFVKENRLYE